MQTDPILREVYRIKDELNREIGGDVEKLFKRFRTFARQHPERMARPVSKAGKRCGRRAKAEKPVE